MHKAAADHVVERAGSAPHTSSLVLAEGWEHLQLPLLSPGKLGSDSLVHRAAVALISSLHMWRCKEQHSPAFFGHSI